MNQVKSRYKVILDNLLEVTPNDPSVFTTINNKFFFDVYKLFGDRLNNVIVTNKSFKIPVVEVNLLYIIDRIEKMHNPREVLHFLKENDQELSDYVKSQLMSNFEETKIKIIEKIRVDFQKSTLKWKLVLNRSREINDEINIWPLHLGFMYVSLVIEDKVIYAPLFFKEVILQFENGRPFLISNGDIKANEKLIFILNNAGFNIHFDFDYSEFTIQELITKLKTTWVNYFKVPDRITGVFNRFRSDDIHNRTLEIHPGITLGIFLPSGGYARNRMKEIIEKEEIENIFDIEFNKNIYKYKIKNTIFDRSVGLFKITPTNFSQDKAIVSALNQNTIIWGPPGTGKSQTIVNLIANVLVYGKTALIASQKKAALEVIRNRMSDLRMFCLFILTSKDMKKRSFYKPLKDYINYLEYFEEDFRIQSIKIMSESERTWVDKIGEIIQNPKYLEIVDAYFYLLNNTDNLTNDEIDFVLSLPRNVAYPHVPGQKMSVEMIKANKLSLLNFTRFMEVRKLGKLIDRNLCDFKGNLADLVIKFRNLDKSDLEWFRDFLALIPDMDKEEFTDLDLIKKIVAERVIKKITAFDEKTMREYNEFAASIRIGNLEPYKFIKKYGHLIKQIFPIIIATPDTDLSSWNKGEFDYAIMDESSQIFIEKGLPILYLANTKILAGDDKQMKPTNWFGVRTTDESIFGNVESLLDYAQSLGVYNILLDKNYRSNHASLMTFSSKYFYNSSLDVIDSALNDNSEAIEVIEVKGTWEDNKNILEAKTAIEQVSLNLNKYKKIILLAFNTKQADYITNLIYTNFPKLEYAIRDRKLMIRNIENIQGDEADLIVATIAYDKNAKIYSTYVGRQGGMNALNVAISRAKEKMIVIKTIKSSDILNYHNSPDTAIFREWLKFLELTNAERRSLLSTSVNRFKAKNQKHWKSTLVDKVKEQIKDAISTQKGIEIVENYQVGTVNIDLVVLVDGHPYKCFIFDDFAYAGNYESYVLFKDYYRFLKSKHYDTQILNDIIWLRDERKIMEWFTPLSIDRFIDSNYNYDLKYANEEEEYNPGEDITEEIMENAPQNTVTKEWDLYLEKEREKEKAQKAAEKAKEIKPKAKTATAKPTKTTVTSRTKKETAAKVAKAAAKEK
ncbi:ATP-binding protein [Mycoplasma sp. Ms02]|uniref:DEAD/DEAH box helicase n=1 Tax=Mycoplasma sp. Ms02 TaxID=353851 RepID=UPI001C891BD1|nr:DEAD/DEAH box helicase [Mycoplasma sp. Ms02]QZE12318.1 DNA2/NAM7 family helicase [Mycoplasma sp. Ms02]